ncbi:Uncharacterized protein FWK35_00032544 [Aphis craccivora]|uniref:MULE domain-containing protein n=1 Tax=Aphis craccivora TaxID=307492 RepID=A0A6G0W0H1_APHCR|nr:Uncharacterized protein FWK35_00032544 [Aphis craccivora]
MDGLAFLPIGDIKDGMAYLKNIVPEEAESLLNYFDETYVNGNYSQVKNENNKIVLRNCPPIFPPNLWNVNESTLNDEKRTNNSTEGWNLRFSKLVGQTHPTIWTIINKIKLEVASDETKLAQIELGVRCTQTEATNHGV